MASPGWEQADGTWLLRAPREEVDARLDALLKPFLALPEVWSVRPTLAYWLAQWTQRSAQPVKDWMRVRIPMPAKDVANVAIDQNRTMFCWETLNQRRAFGPLVADSTVRITEYGGWNLGRALPTVLVTSGNRGDRFGRRLHNLAAEIMEALELEGTSLIAGLTRHLTLAAQHLVLAQRLVDSKAPRQVVVGTQHGLQARAMTRICRAATVPTVYVPHAPVANNRIYRDLPTDVAALRGPREISYYASLGVDSARLYDIGNLSIPSMPPTVPCPDGPIIVAPSPWEPHEVAKFMAVVEQAVRAEFVVCPHPRSDRHQLRRLLPSRARLLEIRTLDAIAGGCQALIEHSSGVALEAMLMGAPVIDLCVLRDAPSYPAIEEPYVRIVRNAAGLDKAIDQCHGSHRDAQARLARDWAEQWVSQGGETAAIRLRNLLASDFPATGALRDEWAPIV